MSHKSNFVPKDLGYYFPAEWEPHRATWLSLPLNNESWPGMMEKVYHTFFQFVKVISLSEKVSINVHNEELKLFVLDSVNKYQIDPSMIELYLHPTNDCWCRDHGPAFLKNESNEKIIVNWEFNAWGNKYPSEMDNQIPVKIAETTGMPRIDVDMVQEGGSVEFNGAGTILTTTSCLLNSNRNPGLTKDKIEKNLKDYYGADQILWLEEGITGDDTDGHIDDIARFINEDTVLTVVEQNSADENYEPLKKNRELLNEFRLNDGRPLTVIELPMPAPVTYNGNRLPASYANFYITNSHVIVPVFHSGNDKKALSIMESCFPGRRVVGIDSTVLIHGLGSFHCLSQQEPE